MRAARGGEGTRPGWRGAEGGSPVVLEVGKVVENVRVRLALGKGEAWVGEVAEHLLNVRVDPVGRSRAEPGPRLCSPHPCHLGAPRPGADVKEDAAGCKFDPEVPARALRADSQGQTPAPLLACRGWGNHTPTCVTPGPPVRWDHGLAHTRHWDETG